MLETTSRPIARLMVLLVLSSWSAASMAHAEVGVAGGLLSGLMHPIYGPDHLLAMVAVGLWGAQLGTPAIYLLPITFPVVMALGGLLGVAGMPLPFIEVGIALSALALGAMVAANLRPPLWIAAALVGLFAIFHGHAHGTEMPDAANPLAYGIGFIISTGLLHLTGILIGLMIRWPIGALAIRICGAIISGFGLFFMASSTGLA
ncbi:MAG: HupE/UreJ family protein [Candidatus Thiodiazotropha taylori]|nr:HupE/UreJ family protein [Candidatus Thiodiazotropha endolucinida]MCW4228916.1 HupE/UreJ family protein [Candidatus Thiodiazotropha taylori]